MPVVRLCAVALPVLFALARCTEQCAVQTLATVPAPDASITAELEMSRCGAVDAWTVWVSSRTSERHQVFKGRMPPPVRIEDMRDAVSIRWTAPSTLVVRAPSWVRTLTAEKKYGSVTVTYEVNPVPYPKPESR